MKNSAGFSSKKGESAMKILIDTNILLDAALARPQYARAAQDCLSLLVSLKAGAYLTATTITDIYYLSRRELRDAEAALQVVRDLLGTFSVAAVDGPACLNALSTGIKDYEDAIQAVCAKRIKADYILTRNGKDFSASPVPAIAPEAFLREYGNN